jgi:predicted DNA-binding transcriptional regulator YafY
MDSVHGRLLTLLELLQVYRRMSARDIANRLEIEPRTVRRYVAALQEMGIPIEGERGPAGGYRLRPGFRLPPLMFTNDEALALVVGLLASQRLGLLQPGTAAQGAMAKLDRVLPDVLRGQVRAMYDLVAIGLPPARSGAEATTVLTASSAAADGVRLRIRYRSAGGDVTERLVDPYGVAFQSGVWYLAGWDRLRAGVRTFRLDRILQCEATGETFERPAGFDITKHVQRMLATLPYRYQAEVLLATSMKDAARRIAPTIGTLSARPDGVLFRVGADELDWIAGYVAGLNLPFSVVGPPELREAFGALAGRLTEAARGGPAPA